MRRRKYASRINEVAKQRGEVFLKRYGDKTSSEWMPPKVWQILDEDETLYQDMDYFVEAADWVSGS